MKKRKYRVWYHYYRQYNCMSVHFKGQCHRVKNIKSNISTETHWKKSQPNLVEKGWCHEIVFENDTAIIN